MESAEFEEALLVSISWIRVLFQGAWRAILPLEFTDVFFEESRDGKREMAAEISLPVTLASTFFLYRVVTQRALRDDIIKGLRRKGLPVN